MKELHNYMRGGITPKQREYYNFVRAYIHENGASPSLQEIADEFDVTVPNAANKVRALVERGFLTKVAWQNRGLDLVR